MKRSQPPGPVDGVGSCVDITVESFIITTVSSHVEPTQVGQDAGSTCCSAIWRCAADSGSTPKLDDRTRHAREPARGGAERLPLVHRSRPARLAQCSAPVDPSASASHVRYEPALRLRENGPRSPCIEAVSRVRRSSADVLAAAVLAEARRYFSEGEIAEIAGCLADHHSPGRPISHDPPPARSTIARRARASSPRRQASGPAPGASPPTTRRRPTASSARPPATAPRTTGWAGWWTGSATG